MEFDKSRVYTALNADELKIGSKIIVADTLSDLKERVKREYVSHTGILVHISDEKHDCRFVISSECHYELAYLISEPEEKKLKWTDLKLGDVIRRKDGLREGQVTFIDKDIEKELHICCGSWLSDRELEDYNKVEGYWEKVE